jgi:hypothetical protein
VAGGELRDRAGIDQHRALLDVSGDLFRGEARQFGDLPIRRDSAPIAFGQHAEVGGERSEPGEEPLDELVLVGHLQQGVGGPLPPDGGGPLRARWGGAERPGTVCRVHGEVVGEDEDLVAQRPEQLCGEFLAVLVAEQVGPSDGADHERAAGEECRWRVVLQQR